MMERGYVPVGVVLQVQDGCVLSNHSLGYVVVLKHAHVCRREKMTRERERGKGGREGYRREDQLLL
jgi:hypothetical protein